jgi:hypothetical protein
LQWFIRFQQALQVLNASFGIQDPKEIKNEIERDNKNENNLWEEAIKIELKQLTGYLTFIIVDSGEDFTTGYQKIPYHMDFDIKYDLRHKSRLFAGYKWNVSDRGDIYSGFFRIDTVRIRFLGELYDLSYCACDIVNVFLYVK